MGFFPTPGVDARAVANILLAKGQEDEVPIPIGQMKLLKLTYIAHGWVLGLLDKPLISQEVLAWPYGPVIRDVYNAFRAYGKDPITAPAFAAHGLTWKPYEVKLDSDVQEVVDDVWSEYKGFTGLQLSTLTHKAGTPWAIVTAGKTAEQIRDIRIPNQLIRDYYCNLAEKSEGA